MLETIRNHWLFRVINGFLVLLLAVLSVVLGVVFMSPFIKEQISPSLVAGVTAYIFLFILYLVLNLWGVFHANHEFDKVKKIAYSDKMTNLGNRRAYEEYISMLNESFRNGTAEPGLFVLMIDANGLKKTNDIFGHVAGDELVIGVAECILKVFGEHGRFFRAGGDEFVVITAMSHNDYLSKKKEMEQALSDWKGEHIHGITVAMGKADRYEFPDATAEELVDIADRRMYEEKQRYYASQLVVYDDDNESEARKRARYADNFTLTKYTMPIIRQMAEVIPGGFFIYREDDNRELIYYNRQVLEIFGCETGTEFRTLTGGTFEGMVYKDDFKRIQDSIDDQINAEEGNGMDHVIYRIIRKDGSIRWIDDYGHFSHSEDFGDIYYVFINDITEVYESRMKNKN
ncbi:MAG: diguanylate cyclase [Lachnospiraceae bacterium]|nr:diguanylate cyclase [Lachnospiraceae bacterium]